MIYAYKGKMALEEMTFSNKGKLPEQGMTPEERVLHDDLDPRIMNPTLKWPW